MPRKRKPKETAEYSQRKQPLGVSSLWDSVPDAVIVNLVRAYASMGDAILFGTSADREVAAIRVYRYGTPYSVYFRKMELLDDALDRLDRYMPAMRAPVTVSSWSPPQVQVKTTPRKPLSDVEEVLADENVRKIEDIVERNKAFASRLREIQINRVAPCK